MSIRSRIERGQTFAEVARVYNMTEQQVKDFINPPQPKSVVKKKTPAKKKRTVKK